MTDVFEQVLRIGVRAEGLIADTGQMPVNELQSGRLKRVIVEAIL